MRRTALASALPLWLALMPAACAPDGGRQEATSSANAGDSSYVRGDLGTLTYRAVDILFAAAPQVTPYTPLIVATVADVRDVETSSALGNIVADMIRTRIAQDGRTASEVRLRTALNLKRTEGELLLSRDRRALIGFAQAGAIVTGTYAVGVEKVYISLKLLSATDGRILSGADFVVPVREVNGLLGRA